MELTSYQRAAVKAGVRNLRDFGYPGCNEENILTATLYRAFFVKMLEDTIEDEKTPLRSKPDLRSLLEKLKA